MSEARILVVDDEDEIRRAVGRALAGRDYEVSEAYWRPDLERSKAQRAAAPAAERLKHVTAEIADLQRRIERQVANLEADDTTSALLRRIVARIAELEQHVEERQERRGRSPKKRPTHRPPRPTWALRSIGCR